MKRSLAVGILERVRRSNETVVAVPRRRRRGAATARLLSRRLAAVINGEVPEEPLQGARTPPEANQAPRCSGILRSWRGFFNSEAETGSEGGHSDGSAPPAPPPNMADASPSASSWPL